MKPTNNESRRFVVMVWFDPMTSLVDSYQTCSQDLSYSITITFQYFLGEKEAKIKLSQWIKKENETRYYIGRPFEMAEHLFQFLQTTGTYTRYVIDNDKGN